MAVTEFTTPLDVERIRADFPILQQPIHGKRLVYLDSASSSQKPQQMIDTLTDVYRTSYANVHRGVYELGSRATERYEGARDIMAGFVNASDRREVVFVREATEALNLVAYAYGRTYVKEGAPSSPPRWSITRTWCPGSSSPSRPAPRSTICG